MNFILMIWCFALIGGYTYLWRDTRIDFENKIQSNNEFVLKNATYKCDKTNELTPNRSK